MPEPALPVIFGNPALNVVPTVFVPFPHTVRSLRFGTWPPTSADSSGYAPWALERGSEEGTDKVPNSRVLGDWNRLEQESLQAINESRT